MGNVITWIVLSVSSIISVLCAAVIVHNKQNRRYRFVYVVAALLLLTNLGLIADLIMILVEPNYDRCDNYGKMIPGFFANAAGLCMGWAATFKYHKTAYELPYQLSGEPLPEPKRCRSKFTWWLMMFIAVVFSATYEISYQEYTCYERLHWLSLTSNGVYYAFIIVLTLMLNNAIFKIRKEIKKKNVEINERNFNA